MLRKAKIAVGAAVAIALSSADRGAAAADPAPPAQQQREEQQLIPPRPIFEEPARYPEGATGAASVVLEVLVERDGSISDVYAVEGTQPFAAAAIEAVRKYRFTPARRADQTVRARIRMVVTFTPPPPPANNKKATTPATPYDDEKPAAPPPVTVVPTRVEEVTILGARARAPTASPTEHRIGRADIRLVPGAFGDPYRAIDMLPGVVPTVSGLPYYYIRGAPPSAVGYFIDDMRVPFLFHFALGPGVIQPALIDEVTLHPAAFPGRYGRYAGAIVAGKTREPATKWTGEGQIRIYDAGAYVEAPFAGGRGSAGVGGRYSYTAAMLSLFTPDTTLDYRDYNGRFSYQLSDRWRASAVTIGSYDYASQIDGSPRREQVLFASEFHRLDLRLDRQGSDGSMSRIAMTFGLDRSRIEGSRFAQDFLVGVRARHGAPIRSDVDVEVGIDTLIDSISGDLPSVYAVGPTEAANAAAFFKPRTDSATGAWASAMWHPYKGFDFTATARADVFTSDGKSAVGPSPRVSMRVPISSGSERKIAFLGALGVGAQPPAFAIPIPAIGYAGLPGGIGFGYQKSAGLETELPLRFTLRTVGFHHSYFNLRDFSRTNSSLDIELPEPVPNSPTQAYGLEVFLHRKLSERVGAFISYTLSRSEIGSDQAVRKRISPFDRTHVFQIGGSLDLGVGWRASARFLTYRGWPDEGTDPRNSVPIGRLRPFYRVDARIEKRWQWRKAGYIAVVLEALNATASEEVIKRLCDPECRDQTIGPIVAPSLGVEGML